MSQESSNQPLYGGQYMYSSVTSSKAKLEGLPDNFPEVRGPYKKHLPYWVELIWGDGWLASAMTLPSRENTHWTDGMVERRNRVQQSGCSVWHLPKKVASLEYLVKSHLGESSCQSGNESVKRWVGWGGGIPSEMLMRAAWSEGSQ